MKSLTIGCAAVLITIASASAAGAAPIFWTDWTSVVNCGGNCVTVGGTINSMGVPVGVTYTNRQGVGFVDLGGGTDYYVSSNAISPYVSAAASNRPTGTDIIALQWQGTQTLTFSQAIANPVFAFVSLNGNGYSFLNQDFNILSQTGMNGAGCGYWGCGNVTKTIVNLGGGNFAYQLNSTGGEPHGVIQFTGAFSTLQWDSSSNEYWNGFTVGIQGTAQQIPTNPAVPEPGTMLLLGTGLAAAAVRLRRRQA